MEDRELRAVYEAASSRLSDSARCLSPEQLEQLAQRSADDPETLDAFDHVMACARCRRDFELLRSVFAAERRERSQRRRWAPVAGWALAAGIAGIGLVTLLQSPGQPGPGPLRGEGADIVLVEPSTEVSLAQPLAFAWQAVPDALGYTVEILDDADAVVLSVTVAEPEYRLSAVERLGPGRTYRWWVSATTRAGVELRSPLRTLRVRAP